MNATLIEKLQEIIQNQLPGEVAHKSMIPSRLMAKEVIANQLDYRKSAVAILLYEQGKAWKSVLIQRPEYEGAHSGQMAFPGGKYEETDANLKTTALREMMEEIDFKDSDIHHLGELTQLYIPVSKFMVYPHVFYTKKNPVFKADEREVNAIIPFEIEVLLDEKTLTKTTISFKNGTSFKEMPCFMIEEKIVWGATCLILNELKYCLKLLK